MPTVYGECCICGRYDELSFEHVPPRAAFNNNRIFMRRGRSLFDEQGLVQADDRGQQQQAGAGEHTLCTRCNNETGRYGRAYAEWATQAARLVLAAKGNRLVLAYPFRLLPLRVIKQIACMFMSASGPGLRRRAPYLEHFVMNKWETGLPPDIRIHAGLTHGQFSRSAGITGLIADGSHHVFAEIAFRPLVFVMTFASRCPEPRMLDISTFATYHYPQPAVLYLPLPVLHVRSQFPSDYRSEEEIISAAEAHGSVDRAG